MPRRAERTRLAHQPQRNRRRDDVADDESSPISPSMPRILVPGRMKATSSSLQGLQPRQPLLTGQRREGRAAEQIESPELRTQVSGISRPLLVDDRAARLRTPEACVGSRPGTSLSGRDDVVVRHGHGWQHCAERRAPGHVLINPDPSQAWRCPLYP